jgi:CheY-like chemotaxis protein
VVGETISPRALEIFSNNPNSFDIVITDMTMPKMTGEELSKRIRQINQKTPIIICTGFSSMLNEKKLADMGANGLLAKPVKTRDLALMIRSMLDPQKTDPG